MNAAPVEVGEPEIAFVAARRSRGQVLNLGGQVEVFLGEATCVVGYEGEADAVVADVDVGVVPGLFGKFTDAVHEVESGAKVLELKCVDELAGFNLPAGQACQAGLSGIREKDGHGFAPQPVVSG
jgi:hypothetical protein